MAGENSPYVLCALLTGQSQNARFTLKKNVTFGQIVAVTDEIVHYSGIGTKYCKDRYNNKYYSIIRIRLVC